MASPLFRTTCLLVLASPCLADPTQSEEPDLRKEILKWIHERDDFTFAGSVEYELIRRSAPDPSRAQELEQIPLEPFKESPDPTQRVANMETLDFQRRFVKEWSDYGVEVIQGWRIISDAPRRIRAEVSFGYIRPERKAQGEPVLTVVASNGEHHWEWDNKTGQVIHDQPPSLPPVQSSMLDQARSELVEIFVSRRSWLLEGRMTSVEEAGRHVVAEFAREDAPGQVQWQTRLKFERSGPKLLLTHWTARRAPYYFEASFSDYRAVGEKWVPYHAIHLYGPIEDAGRRNRQPEEVKEYVIRSIDESANDSLPNVFDIPARARRQRPEESTFSYEDITGPGSTPFLIKAP